MRFFWVLPLLTLPLWGSTFYIVSPYAKLHKEPNAASQAESLPEGTQIRKLGEEGLFIKVRYNKSEGWVNKLFVSANPPQGKVNFGSQIDKSTAVQARARASAYSQTAAARGFMESKPVRTKSPKEEYDFESIQWLENITSK